MRDFRYHRLFWQNILARLIRSKSVLPLRDILSLDPFLVSISNVVSGLENGCPYPISTKEGGLRLFFCLGFEGL